MSNDEQVRVEGEDDEERANRLRVARCFYWLENWNAFGFNTLSDNGFILAICTQGKNNVTNEQLQERSGARTARIAGSYAGYTLDLGIEEYDKQLVVIQAALDLGVTLQMQNALMVVFKAGEQYSYEEEEKRAVATYKDYLKSVPMVGAMASMTSTQQTRYRWEQLDRLIGKQSVREEWCWSSEEGRRFARQLVQWTRHAYNTGMQLRGSTPTFEIPHYRCMERYLGVRGRYYEEASDEAHVVRNQCTHENCVPVCPEQRSFMSVTISCRCAQQSKRRRRRRRNEDQEANVQIISDDDDDDDNASASESPQKRTKREEPNPEPVVEQQTCVVCFERQPNTMVLPCMHAVVCSVCSRKLEQSDHRNRCIYCRAIIETVLYEDGDTTMLQ